MTSLVAALRPALTALDLALADTAPGGKGLPAAPRTVEDACGALHATTAALGQALLAVCDPDVSATALPALAQTLYGCTADAVGGYHALADAAQREPRDIAWARLLDFARDNLVELAQAVAELMAHKLHGSGQLALDLNLTLPGDRADLQRLRPQRLAYGRHIVQTALRDAQRAEEDARRAEDDAPRLARALRGERAAADHAAKELAKSIFWSQVAAAGLAFWLFG